MNEDFEWQLVSLLPHSSPIAACPMVIETVYHHTMKYLLELLEPSLDGESLHDIIVDQFFDPDELQTSTKLDEQFDVRAWALTPVYAGQMVWTQNERQEWCRAFGIAHTETWFTPDTTYCILYQAFDCRGHAITTELRWFNESDADAAADKIALETVDEENNKDAALVAYTVYEPRLAAAYSILRPHPVLNARSFGHE